MSVSTWLLEDTQPTLRDYFAAAALHGLITNGGAGVWHGETADHHHGITRRAYLYADAMLKARGDT